MNGEPLYAVYFDTKKSSTKRWLLCIVADPDFKYNIVFCSQQQIDCVIKAIANVTAHRSYVFEPIYMLMSIKAVLLYI